MKHPTWTLFLITCYIFEGNGRGETRVWQFVGQRSDTCVKHVIEQDQIPRLFPNVLRRSMATEPTRMTVWVDSLSCLLLHSIPEFLNQAKCSLLKERVVGGGVFAS